MIAALTVFGAFLFNYRSDVAWAPWCFCAWAISTTVVTKIWTANKIPRIAVLLFAWALFNGVTFMEFRPATDWADLSKVQAIRLLSAHALVEMLLLSWLFYMQWPKIRRPIANAFLFIGLVHAVYLICDQYAPFRLPNTIGAEIDTKGLLGNKSIGATFSVIWMFFAIHIANGNKKIWAIAAVGFLAMIVSKSSISYVGFLVGLLAFAMSAWRDNIWKLAGVCGAICAAFGFGKAIKPQFFDHISRYDAWPMFYKYIDDNANIWTGAGLGSFKFYGPTAQTMNDFLIGKGWWLWAHNDWLQIVLELGWIGFALSLLVYLLLLKKSYNRPALFGAVSAYGVTMVGNYNLHVAPTALIGWWLASEALTERAGVNPWRTDG